MIKANVGNDNLIRLLRCHHFEASLQCLPCYMMSEVDHLIVFSKHLAQNMPVWPPHRDVFKHCYILAVHLFPLYFPGH